MPLFVLLPLLIGRPATLAGSPIMIIAMTESSISHFGQGSTRESKNLPLSLYLLDNAEV